MGFDILDPFGQNWFDRPSLAKPSKVGKNVLQALSGYLPAYQQIQNASAQSEADLSSKLFSSYLPQYSQAGSSVMGQEQNANIQNDVQSILGGGGQAVQGAAWLERLASPEWAKSMQDTNAGYQSLIGGMDPNKLSGSEMANVERGVNRLNSRTGNLNSGDSTTTTANAMQFGGALDQKRQNFGQALNLFPGISQASKSGVDSYNVGTGKASGPNIGTQMFNPNIGTQNIDTAQKQFFGASGVQQQALAQQPSTFEKGFGSICCFIMIEYYGHDKIPESVRMCRDYFYKKQPKTVRGYKKMASWLVPAMQKSKFVRSLVKYSMVIPLTQYSKYLTGESKWKVVFKPFKLWLNFWNFYGSC